MSGQGKRGKVIMELLKGKQMATQLQTLLHQPDDDGLGLAHQLALQILASFTDTLSQMSSADCAAAGSAQISAVDLGKSAGNGRKKGPLPPGVKERRGCYKRRKTSDSWVTVSSSKEDGCAWRKYGQKAIMSSTYPRCYFRCTHKYEVGCKATKQVQRTIENPNMYQITYFSHHTCAEKLIRYDPHDLTAGSDHVDPNLISFETNIQSKQDDDIDDDDQYSPNPMSSISQVKEEFKEEEDDYGRGDQDLGSNEAKSTLHDPWQDINTGSRMDSLGYKPELWVPINNSNYQDEVASSFGHSYEATNLQGLDKDVNELGDIDCLWSF